MGEYLIKGDNYANISKNNLINKTTDIKVATKFSDQKEAEQVLSKATKKLKGFYVAEIEDSNPLDSVVKVKRKSFTNRERIDVYNKNKGRCAICGRYVPPDEFTIDHIIPLAKGGTNEISNLQCACQVCNTIKQDILPQDLMDKLTEIILYQARRTCDFALLKKLSRVKRRKRRKDIAKVISSIQGRKVS